MPSSCCSGPENPMGIGTEDLRLSESEIYWIPIYDALSSTIDTIVANPLQTKTIPIDKPDSRDSKRLSQLYA